MSPRPPPSFALALALACALASASALSACATPPPPIRIPLADLGTVPESELRAGRPLIIEFHEGDVVPLDVTIDGDLVASPANQPPIPLVAKRAFWLRIAKDGMSASRDGVTFGTKGRVPGSFRFGLSATRERGVRGEIVIKTPRP